MRYLLGMTQAEFGDLVGHSKAKVSQWENGAYRVPFEAAAILRRRYGITLDFIYIGEMSGMMPDIIKSLSGHLVMAQKELRPILGDQ